MVSVEELAARAECTDLLARAASAADDGDIAAYAKCFTPDGAWKRPGQQPLIGRQAIEDFMNNRPVSRTTRHFIGGVRVELHSAGRATARSQVLLFGAPAVPVLPAKLTGVEKVFDYLDHLEKTPDGWLIADRQTTVLFSAV
jgi:3-phenylpropionate/cinnamic acid dioxygenase small subunit